MVSQGGGAGERRCRVQSRLPVRTWPGNASRLCRGPALVPQGRWPRRHARAGKSPKPGIEVSDARQRKHCELSTNGPTALVSASIRYLRLPHGVVEDVATGVACGYLAESLHEVIEQDIGGTLDLKQRGNLTLRWLVAESVEHHRRSASYLKVRQ